MEDEVWIPLDLNDKSHTPYIERCGTRVRLTQCRTILKPNRDVVKKKNVSVYTYMVGGNQKMIEDNYVEAKRSAGDDDIPY